VAGGQADGRGGSLIVKKENGEKYIGKLKIGIKAVIKGI
jgi:hypothetical protein